MNNRIHSIGLEYGDANFRLFHISLSKHSTPPLPEHSHRYYELHLCLGGSHDYVLDGQTVPLCRNQLLIIPPHKLHCPASTATEDYRCVVLSFSLSECKGRRGFYRAFSRALETHAKHPQEASRSLIERLLALNAADWSGSLRSYCHLKAEAGAMLFTLFEDLHGYDEAKPPVGLDPDREDLHVLLDNLLNNPDLSLREIAEEINYSERHTARLIRSYYHMSLTELRRHRRS